MTAIVLDTETTGLDPKTSRVLELAIVDWESGATLLHERFNPGEPIPPEVTKIHGITDADVAEAPSFTARAATIAQHVETAEALIGANPWFDVGMLRAEFERCGVKVNFPRPVCVHRLWKIIEPKRDLQASYKRFVDRAGFSGAHSALADTLATRAILRAQLEEHVDFQGKAWAELDPAQSAWVGPSEHVIVDGDVLVLNFGKWKGTPMHRVDRSYLEWILRSDFPDHVKQICDYVTLVSSDPTKLYGWAYGKWMREP
jgi:DNA polymerase-3 subunit epsilon